MRRLRIVAILTGASGLALAVAAVVFLILGPVYATTGVSCGLPGSCVTGAGTKPLGWTPVLAIPLIGASLVLLAAALRPRSRVGLATALAGCGILVIITLLGMASIGPLFVPADAMSFTAAVLLKRASDYDGGSNSGTFVAG